MAISCCASRGGNPLPLLMLIGTLALLAIMGVSALNGHALERHPGDAERVNQCLRDSGPLQLWQADGRFRIVCQLEDHLFGIKVVDHEGKTITAMIKNKMTRLEQVVNYLQKQGNTKVWELGDPLEWIPQALKP